MSELENAGALLVGLSYDEPDALREFSDKYGITFPMLSDPESEVISSFGILNTLIAEDDHPWFGIPFPGIYITDARGVITEKFFESSLALRPGIDQLVRAVRGETVALDGAEPVAAVDCTVTFDDEPAPPGVLRELVVTLRVPEGQHLYGQPVLTGMVATHVEIEPSDNLIVRDTIAPPTHSLVLAGTGETLQVYDGNVTLRVPITHSGQLVVAGGGRADQPIRVAGRVRWQSCDDNACNLPESASFSFTMPTGRITGLHLTDVGDDEMDSMHFLHQMVERRKV